MTNGNLQMSATSVSEGSAKDRIQSCVASGFLQDHGLETYLVYRIGWFPCSKCWRSHFISRRS